MRTFPSLLASLSILVLAAACAGGPAEAAGTGRGANSTASSDAGSGASPAGRSAAPLAGSLQPVAEAGRVLVAYYSQGGSARRVAEDLAYLFGADLETITELEPRKPGFFGFMKAGRQSSFKVASPIRAPERDPADYDRLIVLTPVWSWHLSPPVRSWLRLWKGRLPAATAFVTVSGDTEPEKIAADMAKESGREPLAIAGFADRDFSPENREAYLGKMAAIAEALRP
jgi:menaquinone-dependent protoporphyrinogen IX oxidase